MGWILTLDQGTTSSRSVLFDETGAVRGFRAIEYPQSYPRPGWVEHDPRDILTSQLESARVLMADHGLTSADLAGVGIANQRETVLIWRRDTGEPIHPAIVWQDRRTSDRCAELRDRVDWLHARTGLLPDPYFSATKIEWLLDQVPGARGAAEAGELACGTVDTWLMWNLSGGATHRTDVTNASRTMLWNLADARWDPDLLALFRIPAGLLPEVLPSSSEFVATGAGEYRVTGVAGDQQAALFGQGGWRPGIAKNTYGTGCFLLLPTGGRPLVAPRGLLTTAACSPDGSPFFALEGSVFVAGAAVQWLRDGLGIIASAAETEALARSVPHSDGVFVVPAFTGLGAPYWDPDARGTITGLTRGTSRAHLVRATLESIALQTCDVVEAMTQAGVGLTSLRVDGGAVANDWLMQLQADLLGIPVERAAIRETTALGAAYLAGLGAGLWQPADLARLWRADRVFEPQWGADRREAMRAGWRDAVRRTLSTAGAGV